VRILALDREVLEAEGVDVLDGRVNPELGKGARRARDLLVERLDVVELDVRVADDVDELARLEAADLREEAREERVGGDVEGHAETHVARALLHLAAQLAPLDVDVELRKEVAGRQRHLGDRRGVPRGEDDAAVRRVRLDAADDVGDLVDARAAAGRGRWRKGVGVGGGARGERRRTRMST
jgi:hypothetical protein